MILVIGAGIAGLSAAYHLQQAGRDVIVFEARNRIGGRVHTRHDFAEIPVEFGAELIHGHRVITWEWVRQLGLTALHWQKLDDSMVRLEDGRLMTMLEARQQSPEFDTTRSWDLPDTPAEPGENLADYLRRIGFTETQMRYVQRSFANAEGDAMRHISAEAVLAAFAADDPHHPDSMHPMASSDYRIQQGYSAFYNALAEGLDIRLNTPVYHVDWRSQPRVYTADGTLEADAVIITLPVGVLQSGDVSFNPVLPPQKQNALNGLAMGPVMKMIYYLPDYLEAVPHQELAAIYSADNPPMWWSPSYLRSEMLHESIWTAFFSGDYAREMLALGEDRALQKGLNALRRELNQPDLEYERAEWVNWPHDPYSKGGYSVVLPGHHGAREQLAVATHPLYWAGEATASPGKAATVHGAYESGQRAANELLTHREG
jgi:monoamine oxidase